MFSSETEGGQSVQGQSGHHPGIPRTPGATWLRETEAENRPRLPPEPPRNAAVSECGVSDSAASTYGCRGPSSHTRDGRDFESVRTCCTDHYGDWSGPASGLQPGIVTEPSRQDFIVLFLLF